MLAALLIPAARMNGQERWAAKTMAVELAVGLALTLMGTATTQALAGEVSLTPTRFELSMEPGSDRTVLIQVYYGKDNEQDTQPLRFVLTTEDWDISESGSLHFDKGEPGEQSARPWIIFSPREQELTPGETGEVRMSVIVPEGMEGGEYRAALILQPRVPYRNLAEGERRVDLTMRLGTTIYVDVPPTKPAIDLIDLGVARTNDGWSIQPTFLNPGQVHIRIHDRFEIFEASAGDEGGRAARAGDPDGPAARAGDPPLDLPVYAQNFDEAGVVLPDHRRVMNRRIPPFTLGPGRYLLVYTADPGRGLPYLQGETIFEIPGDLPPSAAITSDGN